MQSSCEWELHVITGMALQRSLSLRYVGSVCGSVQLYQGWEAETSKGTGWQAAQRQQTAEMSKGTGWQAAAADVRLSGWTCWQ